MYIKLKVVQYWGLIEKAPKVFSPKKGRTRVPVIREELGEKRDLPGPSFHRPRNKNLLFLKVGCYRIFLNASPNPFTTRSKRFSGWSPPVTLRGREGGEEGCG